VETISKICGHGSLEEVTVVVVVVVTMLLTLAVVVSVVVAVTVVVVLLTGIGERLAADKPSILT